MARWSSRKTHGGKSDARRPTQVDEETFESNWEETFGSPRREEAPSEPRKEARDT